MELSDGTNTISDARFDAAAETLRLDQYDDQMAAAAGRTEELPYQMSARHAGEWRRLDEDRKHLSVQEWLKRYPDPPDLKQREGWYAEANHQPPWEVAGLTDKQLLRALEEAASRPLDEAEKAELRQIQVLRPRLRM